MLTAFRIDAEDETEGDLYYEHLAALIRNVFKVDPDKLALNEFAKLAGEAIWLKKFEAKMLESAVLNAINKSLSDE